MALTEEQQAEWDSWITLWRSMASHGRSIPREDAAIAIDQHLRDLDAALAEIRREAYAAPGSKASSASIVAIRAILQRLDGGAKEAEQNG